MSKRRQKHEEHESHERWLVSYADFITLLFAFFVVMYATSNNDEGKQKEFEESVRAELKLAIIGQGASGGGQSDGNSIFAELLNPLDRFPKRGGPEEIRDYMERQIRRRLSDEERQRLGLEVRADRDGARISFSAESFFPSGSPQLKRSAVEGLKLLGGILAETEKRVVVEGHTDNVPLKGGEIASNWELASLRATSVVRYLIVNQGVDPQRLAATSYADQVPLVPNTTEENRSRNRRIEILIKE